MASASRWSRVRIPGQAKYLYKQIYTTKSIKVSGSYWNHIIDEMRTNYVFSKVPWRRSNELFWGGQRFTYLLILGWDNKDSNKDLQNISSGPEGFWTGPGPPSLSSCYAYALALMMVGFGISFRCFSILFL